MFMDQEELAEREQPFTREQGQQVYRFKASTRGRKRERIIEIQGEQTLADFDDVMRQAFNRDPMDHLSEFTRIIRRGKGKQPREVHYGELNPFEMTAAARLRVAGLGLEVGAELQYVYDFGDWIEHTLLLEGVHPPEGGVEYPRVVSQPSRKL
jgi:hypothetical protein